METEQIYNEFITRVVREFDNFENSMKSVEKKFPYGGNTKNVTDAFLNGTMKTTLLNSIPHVTLLINNVSTIKGKVSSLTAKGMLSRLGGGLKTYMERVQKVVNKIDYWHSNVKPKFQGRKLSFSEKNAITELDNYYRLSDSVRDLRMMIMKLSSEMQGKDYSRKVEWPK